MEWLAKLRIINDGLYETTKDEKYKQIKELLAYDDCFFRLDYETAIHLLEDLGLENPIEMYINLVNPDNFNAAKKIFTISG
ncbi:MAG: hypothetical protein ACI4WW_00590 [Candidatus Coprovivens sp.]